ncbi:hypothetical protein A2U01_0063817, partial [Trifolium medium]|nr:hypothetical protein [Trifolium medium]
MTTSTSEAGLEGMKQLNQNEIEKVRSFLSRLERPTDIPFEQYWILDSGATDH